ncbi:MAG: hypothetical protein HYV92_03075 [Candidatus Rokubacteria bacterium]|nr:hypothetical protein [Candidatus Rokubacteria bacterium]MBI2553407.1 hypothetical protein [Candidatus Rokubacteria bacterium]
MGDRLRALWKGWLRIARAIGTVNTVVLLTVLYWLVVAPLGLILRLLGKDPLRLRRGPERTLWHEKRPVHLDSLHRQF